MLNYRGLFTTKMLLSRTFKPISCSNLHNGKSHFRSDKSKKSDNGEVEIKLSKSGLSQALEDSASFDERTSVGQVQWRSSAYHKDEVTYISRPPTKPTQSDPKVRLASGNDDSKNSVILFPGQGTQYVGMAKHLVENFASARDLYDSASHILGYNLLKICLEGPQNLLNQTKYCQPAVLVTSLCAVEALYSENRDCVKNCIATAGFSVGEITALIFSGAMSFEDGIKLVQARAEAMDLASGIISSGMMTVFYGADAKLGLACNAAKKWVEERHGIEKPVCQIANYLYVGAKTIGGHIECLKFIEENKNDFRIRKVKWLPVSGAFHTPLMLPAIQPFDAALSLTRVADPRIPVYSNIDGVVYKNAATIRSLLPKQIVKCVKWEQSMCNLFSYEREEYLPNVFECGPGNSLSAMMQKINGKVAKKSVAVKG